MPLFHATLRTNLRSILRNGLGGKGLTQLWEGCEPGVYLSSDPLSSLWVMIEQYITYGDRNSSPQKHLKEICLIVIDNSRYEERNMHVDPLIPKVGIYRYQGIIDVTSMPVLSVDDVMRDHKLIDPELEAEIRQNLKEIRRDEPAQ